jgi:diaminohydroxyphosphoribosylaminopyrimidine deaminase/5-amino-6-(5-phosphoribosylamino)uracil reductase
MRARVDAVLVGAETVRADDPHLTVHGVRRARQPWRVVLTRSGKLPGQAHLLSDKFAARTLIYERKSLPSVLHDLGKRSITSVLIEGGGEVLGEALDKRLIDKVQIYLGPILTGGPVVAFPGKGAGKTADALRLREIEYQQIGQTVGISGYPSVPGCE